MVGNFADEEDKREVTRDEAISLVRELGFDNYIETSAYTGLNIASLFETLTKHLYVVYKNKLKEFVSLSLVNDHFSNKTTTNRTKEPA